MGVITSNKPPSWINKSIYFKFEQWEGLAELKFSRSLGCQGQGQSGGARASLECQGQSGSAKASLGVPRPVWGARANLGCQGQSGVPGPIRMCQGHWGARANLVCQGQSGVPGPLRACQSESEVPTPVWGAGVNLECQCKSGVPGEV